jgi:hypothetical protein
MNGWRLMAVHGDNVGVWTVENGALAANSRARFRNIRIKEVNRWGALPF